MRVKLRILCCEIYTYICILYIHHIIDVSARFRVIFSDNNFLFNK